ncbi:MAG TPA: CHAD domain-containing protein [Kribbella sp.]|nr:CHAD domain-containing protein [Kribbella sp.]
METSTKLTPESPAAVLVTAALVKGSARLRTAIGMVAASEDDAIHQVRVACRRLRSDLRLFRGLLAGDWARELRAELSLLALACSEARDLEVIVNLVRDSITEEDDPEHVATVIKTLTADLERAAGRSAQTVGGERTAQLIASLDAVATAPALTSKASRPSAEVLPRLVATARATFLKAAGRLEPWSPDDDWHDVRLAAKRVRYAAESAAVLGDEAKETAAQAARYQDILGRHQDHCAAADALTLLSAQAAASGDAELAFSLGRITERHRAARRPLREEFLAHYHRPVTAAVLTTSAP